MKPSEPQELVSPQAKHFHFLFDPHSTLTILAGQRRRFASTVATLSLEELSSPSRCHGWTVADVLRHLVWVDSVMRLLWSGDESIANGFDPRTTPDESVQADRLVSSDEETRQRYLSSTGIMVVDLESASADQFGRRSLSPAGRVPWWMSAVHMGWDSTIHERDALEPLGRSISEVPAETAVALAYSLVLASLLDSGDGLSVRVGPIHLRKQDGRSTARVIPESGVGDKTGGTPGDDTAVLRGDLIAVIDALSGRGSLPDSLSGDGVIVDRLAGLARFFSVDV